MFGVFYTKNKKCSLHSKCVPRYMPMAMILRNRLMDNVRPMQSNAFPNEMNLF